MVDKAEIVKKYLECVDRARELVDPSQDPELWLSVADGYKDALALLAKIRSKSDEREDRVRQFALEALEAEDGGPTADNC